MTQEFPHFYTAIQWTVKYYGIYAIKDEFELIGEYGYGGANHKRVQETYDLAFELQDRMETEIKYTIQNCYPAAQILHLNLLKDWLDDFRIRETNFLHIDKVINDYNESLYDKLLIEVLEKEEKHRANPYYHLEHGQDYSYEKAEQRFVGIIPVNTGKMETVFAKNNKFFCIDKTPEYLDPKYFEAYISRLDKLVTNFRRILKRYVDLYDSNKLPVYNHALLLPPPAETSIKSLPQPLVNTDKKIKVKANLTIPRLAYLYKMLLDAGIIETATFKELHEFISRNFKAHTQTGDEDISVGKLGKMWNSFDAKTAAYWMDKFIDLHKLAKKDNPNNIKLDD